MSFTKLLEQLLKLQAILIEKGDVEAFLKIQDKIDEKTAEFNQAKLAEKIAIVSSKAEITKSATNPFFKSKYASLDNDILPKLTPLLIEHGLSISSEIINGFLVTTATDTETGAFKTSSIEILNKSNPQSMGGEITYYRRYNIGALFNLSLGDDNDGNQQKNKPVQQPIQQKPIQLQKVLDPKELEDELKNFGNGLYDEFMQKNNLKNIADAPLAEGNAVRAYMRGQS